MERKPSKAGPEPTFHVVQPSKPSNKPKRPPHAGRPKGVPNRATQYRQALIAASGKTPLDILIEAMRFHLHDFEVLLQQKPKQLGGIASWKALVLEALERAEKSAAQAAPYVHPKLAAIAWRGSFNLDNLEQLSDDELKQLQAITRKLAGGPDPNGSSGPAGDRTIEAVAQ